MYTNRYTNETNLNSFKSSFSQYNYIIRFIYGIKLMLPGNGTWGRFQSKNSSHISLPMFPSERISEISSDGRSALNVRKFLFNCAIKGQSHQRKNFIVSNYLIAISVCPSGNDYWQRFVGCFRLTVSSNKILIHRAELCPSKEMNKQFAYVSQFLHLQFRLDFLHILIFPYNNQQLTVLYNHVHFQQH